MINYDNKKFSISKDISNELLESIGFDDIKDMIIYDYSKKMTDNIYNYDKEEKEDIIIEIKNRLEEGYSIEKIQDGINLTFDINKSKSLLEDIHISSYIIKKDIKLILQEILLPYCENISIKDKNKIVYCIALHIESMLNRINLRDINKYNRSYDIDISIIKKEYDIASKIIKALEKQYNIVINDNEIKIIAIFLSSINKSYNTKKISILVITHGDNIASSMVKVTKDLLGITNIYALDIPLNISVDNALNKTIEKVNGLYTEKGLLILVDMGSLKTFGEYISSKLGIDTKTIDMVSTPIILEAARMRESPYISLDDLYKRLLQTKNSIINQSLEMGLNDYNIKKALDYILTFAESNKIYDAITIFLTKINTYFQINNESFKYKMYFHIAATIERAIRKETIPKKDTNILIKKNRYIYKIIYDNIFVIEESFGIEITEDEMAYLIDIVKEFL